MTKHNVSLRAVLLGGSAIFIAYASAATAQTQPAASASDAATARPYSDADEIVVTAQKREQKLNDVGLTVTAIGGKALQERNISSLSDIAQIVPGLVFSTSASNTPVYTLRGVGFNDTTLGSYPDVSVYLDEAPLPFPVMTKLAAFDLERVEVLKGPQGTLFGNNATGGAINYIAAKPTRTFKAGATLGYGRFNTIDGEGYVSGPLSSTLSARVSGKVTHGDGWYKSYTTGEKTGDTRNYAGRMQLLWEPTDRLRVALNANGWLEKGEPPAVQLIAVRNAGPGNPVTNAPIAPANARAADFSSNINPYLDNRLWQAIGRIDYDVTDALTVTSLTSYSDYKQKMAFDGDGTVQNNADFRFFGGGIKSFSQELRLANGGSGPFRFIVGLNYSSDKARDSSELDYRDSTINTGTAPFLGGIFRSAFRANQNMKNYAAFGNAEYDIGDLTVKGGVRYTKSKRDANSCFYGVAAENSNLPFAPLYTFFANLLRSQNGLPPITVTPADTLGCLTINTTGLLGGAPTFLPGEFFGKLNEDNVSWRAGIDYKPRPGFLLYANVAKGYKAGSFPSVAASTTQQSQPVTQESLMSYEAGFKASLIDRTLQANGAVFFYDYRDRQIRSKIADPNFGLLDALVNVPKSTVKGFELELTATPVRGFTAYGNFTYIDAKVKRYTGINPETGTVNQNFDGAALPYTPKYQISTGVSYGFPLGENLSGFGGADLTFRSDTSAFIGASKLFEIRDYATVDLRAGVRGPDDRWSVQVWGKNVFNQYYWDNVAFFFDTVTRWPSRPATYGVTFAYKIN
ncbi:TonB-dependent receptor [Rhizorhabdus wittichii]|uniref:TonB-dependent receptor n=1 Tax=Rhizorhabdus wittichii TaxID=160791 RepID=UPI000363EFF3|nr:TonB-dependent receptor [Rhizorhabdus wittichii]